MWAFVDAHAEDFLSYKELDFTFDHDGVTLIVGRNGSGKSTLFHLLAWVMYGEMPKPLSSVDKTIRRNAEKCLGRVTVEDAHGRVVITRERSARGGNVRVTGFDDRALKSGQQEAINARFGDYRQFITTSLFSGAASSFCRMGDADRKGLMESMVGVGRFAVASDIAKRRIDALTAEVDGLERALPGYEALVERIADDRNRYAIATLTHAVTVMREYRRLVKRATDLAEKATDSATVLGTWTKAADAKRDAAAAERSRQEGVIADVEQELSGVDAAVSELSGKDIGFAGRIRDLDDEIANLQSGKHADMCPTCGQRWPQETDAEHVAEAVRQRKEKIAAVRKDRAPVLAALADKRAFRTELTTKIDELRRALNKTNAVVDDAEYRRLLTKVLTIEADLEVAQQAASEYAESHDIEPDCTDLERIAEDFKKAVEKLSTSKDAVTTKRAELARFVFWRKGFGRTGLPSFLIDASIPGMNETAQAIASELTDGGLIVRFNPAATKGTKSVFDVEVDYAEGGEGFDSISRGEATRVDVAVLFAIRDIAAKRSGKECSQLFLDELFDGADENFVESCIRMLRKMYGDRPVYLISHDPSAASLCDRVLTARKSKAVSTLA